MPKFKNKFTGQFVANKAYIEKKIVDCDGTVVGRIRIKPSSILWKPHGQHNFYSVPLDVFTAWITDPVARAKRTTK